MWYVQEYLVPSLLKQGIYEENISVYNDSKRLGNLKACMEAFSTCEGDGGTWHLQDDVVVCKDFKARTEEHDDGLVCGFSSLFYDGDIESRKGVVSRDKMWFSFPCIRIPNDYARECAKWVTEFVIGNVVYERFWKDGVNDDWAFRTWLKQFHPNDDALNITPCLVDHIDYLIGGGTGVKPRQRPVRAQYWEDEDIVEMLKEAIDGR